MKPIDLNVGDVFYECASGINFKMIVRTKPEFDNGKWSWTAIGSDGNIIDYLITEGFEHYGPKIYSQPQYVEIV